MRFLILINGTSVLVDKAKAMSILSEEKTINKIQEKLVSPLILGKYTDLSELYIKAGKQKEFNQLIDQVSNDIKLKVWKLNKSIESELLITFPNH